MSQFRRSFVSLFLFLFVLGLVFFVRTTRATQPPIIINEILVGNAGTNLDLDLTDFSSWIELRNTTGNNISLKGYKLESWPDGAITPDTIILNKLTVPANGYLLLWADETRKGNHVPFKLDMDGGELRLTATDGSFDHVTFTTDQSMDVSYGRNAGGSWAYFDQPTPAAANTTPDFPANAKANFAAMPNFSVPGGLHTGSIVVALSSTTPGATIRYTMDGSRPTSSSPIYGDPITITSTTLLRARTWAAGLMVSPTATESYLFDIPVNLPVFSIVTDNANLFDNKIGIYVKGINGKSGCRGVANWHQSWERPANVEFYELTSPGVITRKINQEIGLEISGNCTRNFPQKSFELKARKTYGDNDMDYAFFSDKPMTSYKRLILRNGGNDNTKAMLRDSLAQGLAAGTMDLDRQAYRPAVVYLNGQYWGLYDIREKADEDYVENNYDLNEDEFDMIELNGRLTSGSMNAWNTFYNYLRGSNPASPAVYATIRSQMDIDSFMDYIILQTFVGNTDWPRNNTRWWDDHANNYTWRWLLRDLDFAFLSKNLKRDMILFTIRGRGPTSMVFNKLMANAEFRNEFAQRYAAHLNTTFQPANVIGRIDAMADGIRAEIPAHTGRWEQPANLAAWENEVQKLRDLAAQRPSYARETLRKHVGKPADAALTIHADGAGRVLVAGVAVPNGYSGPHFRNIPITLTAVPNPGELFIKWLETDETTPVITIPFNGDTTRTAVFETAPPPPAPPSVVINEINYNPPYATDAEDDLYEFMELANTGATAADLSGFTFTSGIVFTFPAGTTIVPGEYIILAKTAATYSGNGYQVLQWADGNLSNGGETLTLVDTFGQTVDSVTYDDVAPWPVTPDGYGPSLSLLDPTFDNSLPESWTASATDGGTPGAANFP